MNRTFTIVTAALAVLLGVGVSTAEAGRGVRAHRAAHVRGHAARHVHAHRPLHGVRHYFPRHHVGWARYAWLPKQRAYAYYAPKFGWYYWYARSNAFLPVAYLPTYVPVPLSGVVIADSNNKDAADPELPPGAASLPAGVTPPEPE